MVVDYNLRTYEGQFNLGRKLGYKCGRECLYLQIDRYGSPGHRTLTAEKMTHLSYKIDIMTLLEIEEVEVGDEIYLSSALDDGFWAGVSEFFEDINEKEQLQKNHS